MKHKVKKHFSLKVAKAYKICPAEEVNFDSDNPPLRSKAFFEYMMTHTSLEWIE